MEFQRVILFVALGLVLMLIWQAWLAQYQPPPVPPAQVSKEGADATVPSAPEAAPPAPAPSRPPAVNKLLLKQGQQVRVVTDLVEAQINVAGGDLREWWLRQYPVSLDKPEQPFRLLSEKPPVFIARSGLIGLDRQYPDHNKTYTVARTRYVLEDGQDTLNVPLRWTAPDGVRYTKIYTFHRGRYLVDVRYEVDNASDKPWQGYFYGQFLREDPGQKGGLTQLPTYVGGAIYTPEDKFEKVSFSDMDEAPLRRDVKGGWVAVLQHYFVGAWLPAPQQPHQFFGRAVGQSRYAIGFKQLQPVEAAPGGRAVLKGQLYLGPKEQRRLVALSEGMVLTVDYGWLTPISAPLFWLLDKIHGLVGNWGWAIVILTILIKAAFFPLSAKSYKSMARMRKLQPKMKSIKERFGDDKQRYQQAVMELYKTEKVNPLGGCLPILIQIPVFIALYWVLLESVEMRQAPFVLWIKDLSSPDPYFVLPVIMGASMYIQHMLNPQPMDPMQKRLFQLMPIFFTVFFLFFPAGLVLYWVVNNILSIAQQWQITRMIEGKGNKA